MKENNSIDTINFSENNTLSGVPLFNLDNNERGNYTGTMMRELLKLALVQNDDDIFYINPSSQSSNSNINYIDFENGNSVINYSRNAYKKASDDLKYIYNHLSLIQFLVHQKVELVDHLDVFPFLHYFLPLRALFLL